jgi:hypothetical protein
MGRGNNNLLYSPNILPNHRDVSDLQLEQTSLLDQELQEIEKDFWRADLLPGISGTELTLSQGYQPSLHQGRMNNDLYDFYNKRGLISHFNKSLWSGNSQLVFTTLSKAKFISADRDWHDVVVRNYTISSDLPTIHKKITSQASKLLNNLLLSSKEEDYSPVAFCNLTKDDKFDNIVMAYQISEPDINKDNPDITKIYDPLEYRGKDSVDGLNNRDWRQRKAFCSGAVLASLENLLINDKYSYWSYNYKTEQPHLALFSGTNAPLAAVKCYDRETFIAMNNVNQFKV